MAMNGPARPHQQDSERARDHARVEPRPSRHPKARRATVIGLLMSVTLACATTGTEGEPVRTPGVHPPYRLAPQALPERRASAEAETGVAARRQEARPPAVQRRAPHAGVADDGVEACLERFVSDQNAARQRTAARSPILDEALLRWSELFGAVDRALRTPAREIALLTFVRMRVVLESELELDRLHYGPLPPWLPIALRARVQGIEQKMDERRAHSTRRAREGGGGFRWPLEAPIVTSLFGMRRDPFTGQQRFHRGVDLRARTRQRVEAIASGTVTRAAENGGYGLSVEILHDGGFTSTYSHLSLILVQQNDRVAAGDPIGLTGNTGRSTASHLHFELWKGSRPVDPLDFLGAPQILGADRR